MTARAAWLVGMLALVACGSHQATTTEVAERAPDPATPAAVEPAPDLTLPVSAVLVTGLSKQRAAAAWALIETRAGVPADPRQLRRDAQAIWGLGGIADIRIRARQEGGKVSITFEVVARPRLGAIEIDGVTAGARLFDVREALGAEPGEPLDPVRLARGRDAVVAAYRDEGYHFAEASWSTSPDGDDTVDLRLTVVEGVLVTLRSLGFRGEARLTGAELAAIVAQGTGVARATPYRADRLRDGVVFVTAAYHDRGHIQVQVGPIEETFSAERTEVEVVIPIAEGPQFKLGRITVTGDLVISARRYLELLGARRGEVFSRSKLAAGIARVVKHHRDHGKGEPRVDPLTTIDPDNHVVDLELVIAAP